MYATEINEAMKLAAARALAALAKEPVPAEVSAAYQGQTFSFGQGYVIPKPFDPRLIEWLPPAVAQAAMDTGVARKPIEDMDAYKASLRVRIQKAQGRANALIKRYKWGLEKKTGEGSLSGERVPSPSLLPERPSFFFQDVRCRQAPCQLSPAPERPGTLQEDALPTDAAIAQAAS